MLLIAQVRGQLGLHSSLHDRLGELLQQAVLTDDVFRLLVVRQQLVQYFLVDGHRFFSVSLPSLEKNRLHILLYTLEPMTWCVECVPPDRFQTGNESPFQRH